MSLLFLHLDVVVITIIVTARQNGYEVEPSQELVAIGKWSQFP